MKDGYGETPLEFCQSELSEGNNQAKESIEIIETAILKRLNSPLSQSKNVLPSEIEELKEKKKKKRSKKNKNKDPSVK